VIIQLSSENNVSQVFHVAKKKQQSYYGLTMVNNQYHSFIASGHGFLVGLAGGREMGGFLAAPGWVAADLLRSFPTNRK